MTRKKLVRRGAGILLGLSLGFLLAETALRKTTGCLAQILEAAPPDLRYRLRPGSRTRFHGFEMRINSLGLRGGEPRPGRRVLFVGDSHLFGQTVGETETIPVLVEAALPPDRAALNGGTPGYDLFQEAAWIESRATELGAETVVWSLNWGDLARSSQGLEMRPRYFFLEPGLHSCFLRGVARRAGVEGYLLAPASAPEEPFAEADRAFARIAAWSAQAEIPVHAILFPAPISWDDYPGAATHERFARGLRAAGIPAHDLLDDLRHEDPSPFLSYDGGHANALGNRRYAEAILARVRSLL